MDKDSYIKEELEYDMAKFLGQDKYNFLGKDKRLKKKLLIKIIDNIIELFK